MDRKGRKPRRQFGTLRQLPSGRWQASYIGPDGQRHYAPTSFRTERDGATWLTRVEADLSSGKWRDESLGRQLFRDYAEAYLDENPGVGERWAETCRRNMRLHMADLLDKPLVGITPAVVRKWYGKAMKGNGGKRSIGQAYSFGRAVMNAALRDDAIDRNPFNIPGASADTAKERLIATPAEVAALMEAITPRYRAAIALAAWCSLRRGEVCALRTADIDFETKHVHIRKNWVELLESPKMVEKDPKTDAGKRAISVPPHVWPTVVEHSEKWAGPVFFFFRPRWAAHAWECRVPGVCSCSQQGRRGRDVPRPTSHRAQPGGGIGREPGRSEEACGPRVVDRCTAVHARCRGSGRGDREGSQRHRQVRRCGSAPAYDSRQELSRHDARKMHGRRGSGL
jgi:integrase